MAGARRAAAGCGAALLLAVLALATGSPSCEVRESSSVMFGSPWSPNNPYYVQEAAWKNLGNMTKLNLYYDEARRCIVGVKPTFGWQAANARRLGVEKAGGAALHEKDIALSPGESIVKVEYKFGSCVTYLRLVTSAGRALAVGDPDAPGPLQSSGPEAGGAGGWLAYFKGYTHGPNTDAATGPLEQLQLVWATKRCGRPLEVQRTAQGGEVVAEVPPEAVAAGSDDDDDDDKDKDKDGSTAAGAGGSVTAAEVEAVTTETVVEEPPPPGNAGGSGACSGGVACSDGMCATPSCVLNGMGKDVPGMVCYGTNIIPNPLLEMVNGNPCANLACKLDKPGCASKGGFCTGRVVAMGAASQLHASGRAHVGHPCVEHKAPLLGLVPAADYDAKGTYVSRAWKVCDCVMGLALPKLPGLGAITATVGVGGSGSGGAKSFPTLPSFPFLSKKLVNMSLPDVVAQWVAANAADAALPRLSLDKGLAAKLSGLVPDFTLPALVLPKFSKPLLSLPSGFSLPVIELPAGNHSLAKIAELLPDITSLPTIVLPTWTDLKAALPKVTMPQVTVSNLDDWAASFEVPHLPKFSLPNATFVDAAKELAAAVQLSLPLPKFSLDAKSLAALAAALPDFKAPALLIPNVSLPLLKLPSPFQLPVVTLPQDAALLTKVGKLLPRLSALPAWVVPAASVDFKLPAWGVKNVTIPTFDAIWAALAAKLPDVSAPRLPISVTIAPLIKPDLTPLANALAAAKKAPSVEVNWGALPSLLSGLKARLLRGAKGGGIDVAGLVSAVAADNVFTQLGDGFEVSFEAPAALAQWIAGVAQHSNVSTVALDKPSLAALSAALPGLMPKSGAALLSVNMSAPFVKAPRGVAAVTVPDAALPRVAAVLPNLTYAPTLVAPAGDDALARHLTLPDVAHPSLVAAINQVLGKARDQGVKAGGPPDSNLVAVKLDAPPAAAAAKPVEVPTAPAGAAPVALEPVAEPTPVPAAEVPAPAAAEPAAAGAAAAPAVTVEPAAATAPAAAPPVGEASVAEATPADVLGNGAAPGATAAAAEAQPVPVAAAAAVPAGAAPGAAAPAPAGAAPADAAAKPESGMLLDDEGAMIMTGAGPATAYMDPAEFYALDAETQAAFRAIFAGEPIPASAPARPRPRQQGPAMARLAGQLLAAGVLLLLGIASSVTAAAPPAGCAASASDFFGAPWQPSFALYSTESAWRKYGEMSLVDLFLDHADECVVGVKASYGPQADTTKVLGVETGGAAGAASLALAPGEVVTRASVKYGSCITYLRLDTSAGRSVSVGDASASGGTSATITPTAPGGFLAFLKAYTDELETNHIQRLQLAWAAPECAGTPLQAPSGLRTAGVPEAVCSPGPACSGGICPTASCALGGMGKDVLTMMCFGTNLVPNPLLELVAGNPCTNLACKLDRANCTSRGVLGVGGFCTGRVVPMGAAAKLHPSGKAFVGHPCLEHKGPVLDIMPLGDYTARGTYIAKAWKVCDCIAGLGLADKAFAAASPESGALSLEPSEAWPVLPAFPYLDKPLPAMGLPDVLAQWVAARQADADLPGLAVAPDAAAQLAALLPGFALPCLLVPRVSAPLLASLPEGLGLPLVTIPSTGDGLASVAALLPQLTSLPTIAVVVPNLADLAATFGVPALPKVPALPEMTVKDVVAQWDAAVQFGLPLPQLTLDDAQLAALTAALPDFKAPALLIPNVSLPLLALPSPFQLPVAALPAGPATKAVAAALPKLTALPTLVSGPGGGGAKLPALFLPNVTAPGFDAIAASLGAAVPVWKRLPRLIAAGVASLSAQAGAQLSELRLPALADLAALAQPLADAASLGVDLPALADIVASVLQLKTAAVTDAPAAPAGAPLPAETRDGLRELVGGLLSSFVESAAAGESPFAALQGLTLPDLSAMTGLSLRDMAGVAAGLGVSLPDMAAAFKGLQASLPELAASFGAHAPVQLPGGGGGAAQPVPTYDPAAAVAAPPAGAGAPYEPDQVDAASLAPPPAAEAPAGLDAATPKEGVALAIDGATGAAVPVLAPDAAAAGASDLIPTPAVTSGRHLLGVGVDVAFGAGAGLPPLPAHAHAELPPLPVPGAGLPPLPVPGAGLPPLPVPGAGLPLPVPAHDGRRVGMRIHSGPSVATAFLEPAEFFAYDAATRHAMLAEARAVMADVHVDAGVAMDGGHEHDDDAHGDVDVHALW
ncbi:Prx [Scenedesmus sp. PABB004]|nr:Prx [Scenedesmus sp. PABB004]